MRLNDIELTILVKGRPITEYLHEGQTFVEGRGGSEYEIELRNHTWSRLEAVLSVDGLSVIDGKPAGAQSQGYLVEARGTIRIPGWMVNTQTAAKFAFSSMKQSYAQQSGGDGRNNGVIGAMVFREKVKPIVYPLIYTNNLVASSPTIGSPIFGSSVSCNNATASTSVHNSMRSATLSADAPRGIAASGINDDVYAEQSLGTTFGEATNFATRTVSFERGDMLTTLLCYYDEKRGLKARGIKIERPAKRKPTQPQAFPATGCVPPPGWHV